MEERLRAIKFIVKSINQSIRLFQTTWLKLFIVFAAGKGRSQKTTQAAGLFGSR